MTPTYLHVRGINCLHDLKLDLTGVRPGLCAVVGDIGVGKTTVLECMIAAAWYRGMPTRPGSLVDSCTQADSLIELRHTHQGKEFRHVLTVDATLKSPRPEAYLYVDNQSMNDGKTGSYDAAVAELLPPEHLVLASSFAAQNGTGSFAKLDKVGRRALFRSMLGLQHLQDMADRAKAHRQPLDAMAAKLDSDSEALSEERRVATALDGRIGESGRQTQPLRDVVKVASDAHQKNQATHATQAALLGQLDKARTAALHSRIRLLETRDAAQVSLSGTQRKLDDAEHLIDQADAIAEAIEKHADLTKARADAATAYKTARADLERIEQDQQRRSTDTRQATDDLAEVDRGLAASSQAASDIPRLRTKAEKLSAAQHDRSQASADAVQASAVFREADDAARTRQQVAVRTLDKARSELERAERDAAALNGAPCGGRVVFAQASVKSAIDCGTCTYLGTAAEARDALPRLRKEKEAAEVDAEAARNAVHGVADLRSAADEARKKLRELDDLIATLAGADTSLAKAQEDLERGQQLTHRKGKLEDRIAKLETATVQADKKHKSLDTDRMAAERSGRKATEALAALGDVTARQAALQRAEGEAPVLGQAVEDHTKTYQNAIDDLEKVEVPPAPEQQQALVDRHRLAMQSAQTTTEQAQADLEQHLGALSRLRGQREALGDLDAKGDALSASRKSVSLRRAGFVLLERAFGSEGIQALEIDAAGPGVSALCNQLLATIGPEYTVELRTVREADGRRKQKEVFDVVVHDGRQGNSRELSRMSGGEQVLVAEAIKLAIAVHVSQRQGQGLRTIWRDEGDKGLSVNRAASYPAMLRKAMDLGGFDRCYFVTHSPTIACQADTVMVFADDTVTLMDPGDYAASLAS